MNTFDLLYYSARTRIENECRLVGLASICLRKLHYAFVVAKSFEMLMRWAICIRMLNSYRVNLWIFDYIKVNIISIYNASRFFNPNTTHLLNGSMRSTRDAIRMSWSPISIGNALNLLACDSWGRTLEQFMQFLEAKDLNDLKAKSMLMVEAVAPTEDNNQGLILASLNTLWTNQAFSLKPSFNEFARTVFKAEAHTLDFVNQVWTSSLFVEFETLYDTICGVLWIYF